MHTSERKKAGHTGGKRPKHLAFFLKKHKKIVTIVSAATVLLGFIVKETLDEPARDLLSSISSAERDNNQEQSGMYLQLANINEKLEIVADKVVADKAVDDSDLELRNLRADHTKILELLGENISHLVVLKSVLSPSFERDEESFERKYQSLGFPGPSATVDQLKKSGEQWQALYDESRILRGKGVQELMELEDHTEFKHRVYLWLTYLAFGLGWVVGLISNLAGEKDPAAGE